MVVRHLRVIVCICLYPPSIWKELLSQDMSKFWLIPLTYTYFDVDGSLREPTDTRIFCFDINVGRLSLQWWPILLTSSQPPASLRGLGDFAICQPFCG